MFPPNPSNVHHVNQDRRALPMALVNTEVQSNQVSALADWGAHCRWSRRVGLNFPNTIPLPHLPTLKVGESEQYPGRKILGTYMLIIFRWDFRFYFFPGGSLRRSPSASRLIACFAMASFSSMINARAHGEVKSNGRPSILTS